MARLANPPKKGVIPERSPPPSSDVDAATQQLLSESHVAPHPSAVLGADLLNAARVDHPHSSLAGAARKNATGKLKRIKMAAPGPPPKLASRGDMYEIELSPEKGRYTLPERVNHKPLRIVKKKKKTKEAGQPSDLVALSSELPSLSVDEPLAGRDGEEDAGDNLPSSPPRVSPDESATIVVKNTGKESLPHERPAQQSSPLIESSDLETHIDESARVHIEEHLPGVKPRCTVIFYKYNKQGSSHQQCLRPGVTPTEAGPRCSAHLHKPATVQCSGMETLNGVNTRCHRVATKETTHGARCPTHADAPIPQVKPKRKSAPELGVEESSRPQKSSKQRKYGSAPSGMAQPEVQLPVQKSTELQVVQEYENVDDAQVGQHDLSLEAGEAGPASAPTEKRPRSRRRTDDGGQPSRQQQPAKKASVEDTRKSSKQAAVVDNDVAANDVSEDDASEYEESEIERRRPAANEDGEAEDVSELPRPIAAVLKFLDREERPGKCRTELGIRMRQRCQKLCSRIQDQDLSIDEVAQDTADLRDLLEGIVTDLKETDRHTFKRDAYAHIFRALTLYFEALYEWLNERFDVVMESLKSMRILVPFVQHILSFKDTMDAWKVSISSRHNGVRIIKSVESDLIVPLRKVEKSFRGHLKQLEDAKQQHKRRMALERQLERDEEERQRELEAKEAREGRWKRWQDLHIVRMRHEPNPVKRRKLFITKLEDMEERDANGFRFERVPVFKTRSTPHMHLTSSREWTEEQEEALLEGLQAFAGPDVFEKIFENYCKPGHNGRPDGELRDFTVVDILAKTVWVREAMVKLYQEQGGELPNWVSKIPSLP